MSSFLRVVVPLLLVLQIGCRSDSASSPDAGVTDGSDAAVPSGIVVCDVDLPSPSTGTCDIAAGDGVAIAIRGDILGDNVIYENGTVVYSNTRITCVGCDCANSPGYDTATVLSCPGAAVSPGLINPHDHITFTEGSPIDHGSTRYDHRHEWRAELSAPQNPHGKAGDSDGVRWGELRMLMSGVTSMVGSGKANDLVRNLDRLEGEDRTFGFMEVDFQTFSLGDSKSSSTNRPDCGWNYRDSEIEVAGMHAYLPHVAEGIDEYAATEFRCQSSSFGKAEDFTEKNTTHIHSIGLTSADYYNMARDQARILWSPRSNISLYGMTAGVQIFHRLGGVVALGTDWTYSGSANMPRELACADEYNRNQLNSYFSDQDLFEMATINAAIATGSETLIGTLTEDKVADIVIYGGSARYYRSVIEASNEDVALVVLGGTAMFGDADVVSALGQSCDPVDVCGTAKTVCATAEFEKSYSDIQAAVQSGKAAYPAIFCGVPANEPTCIPSRPGEFTGIATADDNDGDGVANASDNCPDVFNPTRPIDTAGQEDADGDGVGDACDETPLPADLDGDGSDNEADNCPFDENADQVDGDSDNKGDVCDFCPASPNPDSVCGESYLEATITEIQDGTIAEDTGVLIKDVVVTAAWDSGFWIQDPAASVFAGVQVFSGSDHGAEVGKLVDVQGRITEFYGDTEIVDTTVIVKGDTTPIEPISVTVAQAATEEYEGMLVSLSDVSSYADPYSCAGDDANCGDEGLWEVNGSIVVYDRIYADEDWATHTSQSSVAGVMAYRFDRRRILPRNAGDLGGN